AQPFVNCYGVEEDSAYYGLAGDIVRAVEPETEADPMAILAQLLAFYGNAVGRGAWCRVGQTRHYPNLFVVLAGETAKARKGTSENIVRALFPPVSPRSGVMSGSGLVEAARDEGILVSVRELLVVESEFATALKNARRDPNLSAILRDAWDGKELQ